MDDEKVTSTLSADPYIMPLSSAGSQRTLMFAYMRGELAQTTEGLVIDGRQPRLHPESVRQLQAAADKREKRVNQRRSRARKALEKHLDAHGCDVENEEYLDVACAVRDKLTDAAIDAGVVC